MLLLRLPPLIAPGKLLLLMYYYLCLLCHYFMLLLEPLWWYCRPPPSQVLVLGPDHEHFQSGLVVKHRHIDFSIQNFFPPPFLPLRLLREKILYNPKVPTYLFESPKSMHTLFPPFPPLTGTTFANQSG